ncbi:MAG: two-component system chemotaxis family sensor kinase [Rhodospirillaceae bacterium]|nr:MAG: two-component system chemotaxis family sensor kinase [Rhodospirillaceae bacterium]TNC96759.1 MAG: two-component system, chemotaxis family, sensor kinase CheA [Stygiobacter sp.]
MNEPDALSPADTFRQEAQELLEQLETTLLDLVDDPADRDLVDTAFRGLHTIKGSGSMFGFDRVAAFTHHVESAFDSVRKGHSAPHRELFAVALGALDVMRRLIDTPDQDTGDEAHHLDRLRLVTDAAAPTPPQAGPAAGAKAEAGAKAAGAVTYRIRFRLPRNAMVMGTNPLLLIEELKSLGDCTIVALTDDIPPLEELDPDECLLGWDAVLTTEQPRSAIDDVFMFVLDDMKLEVSRIDDLGDGKRLGEILMERGDLKPAELSAALDRQKPLGTLLVDSGTVSPGQVASALAEQHHLRAESDPGKAGAKSQASIRVTAERLDGLMDRVGELVIAQARLKQLTAASDDMNLRSIAEEIERLAAELRDTTMGIRMVPIGSLFGRFRRLVHDLSRDLGKDIRLTTSGEETELDKTVIERLADPLVHLIRNCIDHGIEMPQGRIDAGKSVSGHLHLAAHHSGAQVLITITDDGKGLDTLRIRARAEENGLIGPGAKLTESELHQLIFSPGFSTATEISNISGRGVGMDVVKRTIDSLRGTVEVTSTPGQGTKVTLRLPLTLAIIDGLLVRVGRGRYVIPLAAVEECVELTAAEDAHSRGRSFLNIREDLVPFLRLRELFASRIAADPYQKVVIVSSGDLRVGLVVDQVIGDHQTVIKSLSALHADVGTFSGATILGDGTVALILDVANLIDFGQRQEERLQAS